LENAALHGGDVTCVIITLEQKVTDWAIITVSDNGCGILPEKLVSIFDGSAQSGPRSDIKRNMGIGLSVCRTVMLAHGGRISVKNGDNGGASFCLELPMKEEKHEDQG
jgi:two-component system sensor histidine kinase KdpD